MLNKFLREIVCIIVGKHVEDIADLLNTKRYVNEFIIAKKLDITINQTRNILYRISDYGLVSSIRKKDKKKGWYTYFWRFEILKSLEFLKKNLIKRRDQFLNRIKSRETKKFYVCERCNIEFNEENALLHNYTCNECGDIFMVKNNVKILKEFKRNLGKIERELEFVEEEIQKEEVKIEKIKLKEFKKEELEKMKKKEEAMIKRKVAREAKRALKKKEVKKKPVKRKPVKKKPVKRKLLKKKEVKKKPLKKKVKISSVMRKIIKKPVKKRVVRKK